MVIFEAIAKKLVEFGFYHYFFPFIITVAFIYALLRKSKFISESPVINATISLSIAFLIFGFPLLTGIVLGTPFAVFFTQVTVWILIFAMGILLASILYPEIGKFLTAYFVERRSRAIFGLIILGIATFITSGLIITITGIYKPPEPGQPPLPPIDVLVVGSAIIIFGVLLALATLALRGE